MRQTSSKSSACSFLSEVCQFGVPPGKPSCDGLANRKMNAEVCIGSRLVSGLRQWSLTEHNVYGVACPSVRAPPRRLARSGVACTAGGDSPDWNWENEMSLFRKRLTQPNQLETLRRLEEQVDVGRVRAGGSHTSRDLYNGGLRRLVSLRPIYLPGPLLRRKLCHHRRIEQRRSGGDVPVLRQRRHGVGAHARICATVPSWLTQTMHRHAHFDVANCWTQGAVVAAKRQHMFCAAPRRGALGDTRRGRAVQSEGHPAGLFP